MCIQISVCTCVFNSLGCIPRSITAGSYDNSMFNPFRKCQTLFTFYIPTSSAGWFQLLLVFLFIAILGGVK